MQHSAVTARIFFLFQRAFYMWRASIYTFVGQTECQIREVDKEIMCDKFNKIPFRKFSYNWLEND